MAHLSDKRSGGPTLALVATGRGWAVRPKEKREGGIGVPTRASGTQFSWVGWRSLLRGIIA
jgi:hypothetical protein